MVEVVTPDAGGLSVLGLMVKKLLESAPPGRSDSNLNGVLTIILSQMAVTLFFEGQRVRIENGVTQKRDWYIEASIPTFFDVATGRKHALAAFLKREIKFKGNPLKLLRLRKFFLTKG